MTLGGMMRLRGDTQGDKAQGDTRGDGDGSVAAAAAAQELLRNSQDLWNPGNPSRSLRIAESHRFGEALRNPFRNEPPHV